MRSRRGLSARLTALRVVRSLKFLILSRDLVHFATSHGRTSTRNHGTSFDRQRREHPAGQGSRVARRPRGLRRRSRSCHPDHRARVRRLRLRGAEVPRRRHARGRVHRLPPEAGRLRTAPGRRPDDPREAAVRRHHAGPARSLRRRGREVHAAQEGSHHDPPEHPAAPHPAARRREGDPRAQRRGALLTRGLRQHGAQRHRRSLRRHQRRRALRPDPVCGRLRALLRAPSDDAADAAQDQDRVLGHGRRPSDHRDPRHRLHPPRARDRRRRGARLRFPRRRRHVDHAAHRADHPGLRRRRRRRVPARRRGRLPHLRPPGLAAGQSRAGAHQGSRRQDRRRRSSAIYSSRSSKATGRASATTASSSTSACSTSTRRRSPRRRPRTRRRPTEIAASSTAFARRTCSPSARPASAP